MHSNGLPLFVLLASCAAAPRSLTVQERSPAGPAGPLDQMVRVVESDGLAPLSFGDLLERLSGEDVVFVGETHLDDVTHRVEAAVLEGLLERRAGKVVLSLEMFERDVQPVLDEYLAGACDEASFLARSRPWGNYRSDYRPLVELARAHGIPVVAANAPAGLRRKLSSGGRAALEALEPAQRALLPAEILPAGAAYWERVDRATRGHMGVSAMSEEQRLFSGQNLWDNSMGEACARALEASPGACVLHVVGGFHVQSGDGTVAQLRRRAPGARVAVVEVVPTPGPAHARPERDAAKADYLVYATEHARSSSNGRFAVSSPAELRYSLDLPGTASDARRAPLLVWLPDADERPEDARALWTAALGDEAAVCVLEAPISVPAADLAPGGRWTTAGNLRADMGRVGVGLERLVEYVTRRLPVDRERVVIAGAGAGAVPVLWSALYTEWLPARFVAVEPRGAGALHLEGLPDQAPLTRALEVLVAPEDVEGAQWIAEDHLAFGTPAEIRALSTQDREAQLEEILRTALGLEPAPRIEDVPGFLCQLERDLPRARQWAAIHARRLRRAGEPARVVVAGRDEIGRVRGERLAIGGRWSLADLADGQGIPLAPGDFGGTTVLVVPADTSADEVQGWQALERDEVLKKRSPFARLKIALADGQPGLGQVLRELDRGGARSVLVVPAVFCASPAEMRALEDEARALGLDLEPTWLPGLGGELCAGDRD